MAEVVETISPGGAVPMPLIPASIQLDSIDNSIRSVQNGVSHT